MIIASVIAVALYLGQVEETQEITGTVTESTMQPYVYGNRFYTTGGNRLRIELLGDDGKTYTYKTTDIPTGDLPQKGDRVLFTVNTTTVAGFIKSSTVTSVELLEDAEQPDSQPVGTGELPAYP